MFLTTVQKIGMTNTDRFDFRIGSGQFVKVSDDGTGHYFTDGALIAKGNVESIGLRLGAERDLSASMGTQRPVCMKDTCIVYPGGDESPLVPLDQCVVEYNTTLGRERSRGEEGKMYTSVYGVTYVAMAIPEPVYTVLYNKYVAALAQNVKLEKANLSSDGYTWISAKLLREPFGPSGAYCMYASEGGKDDYEIFRFESITAALASLQSNILGTCLITVKLVRRAIDVKTLSNEYKMSITMHDMQMYSTTTISRPPVIQKAIMQFSTRVANPELMESLREFREMAQEDVSPSGQGKSSMSQ